MTSAAIAGEQAIERGRRAAKVNARRCGQQQVRHAVGGRLREPRAARRAGRLAERPRDVDERERDRLLDPVALGAVGERRDRRRPQDPDRGRGEHDQRAELPGRASATAAAPSPPRRRRARRARARGGRGGRRCARRPGATIASSAGGDEEAAGDHRGAGAELVHPQRREHVERAEQQARHGTSARCRAARCGRAPPPAAWRAAAAARAAAPGVRSVQAISPTATTPTPENTGSGPSRVGERAEHRARTARRRSRRPSPSRSARRGARAGPRRSASRARPPTSSRRRRPARSARRRARRRSSPNANATLETPMIERPSTRRRPHAGARGQPAARQRAEERPGRVGGREHARRRLGDAQLVDVVRQQRRDRGVEGRVDEDDGGGEQQQAAHEPPDSR